MVVQSDHTTVGSPLYHIKHDILVVILSFTTNVPPQLMRDRIVRIDHRLGSRKWRCPGGDGINRVVPKQHFSSDSGLGMAPNFGHFTVSLSCQHDQMINSGGRPYPRCR